MTGQPRPVADDSPAFRLTRRQLLRWPLLAAAQAGAVALTAEVGGQAADLWQQHETWREASRPNQEFLARHASRLAGLSLGGSFAPEQWPLDPSGRQQALSGLDLAVRELGMRSLRLGLRWDRVAARAGAIDLSAYGPFLDYCLSHGVEVCLDVGPVRVFRYPEEFVPGHVAASLPGLPPKGATLNSRMPLAQAAFAYLERLLAVLQAGFGGFPMLQLENEPFYPLGAHGWRMGLDYLQALAGRIEDAFPDASLLVTSAGRLDLNSVRDLFAGLLRSRPALAGRLVSGFDFHYKTPLRDSIPLIRYLDQISYARPFAPTLASHRDDSRRLGFRIEVTEGQAEPYNYLKSPGNSARDFRYMLLRCLEEVLDPRRPALIRVWGVEALVTRMLRNDLTGEHRAIIELVQSVNSTAAVHTPA